MKRRQPLGAGSLVGQRYRIEKLIGQGRFWLTYVAGDGDSDDLVVVKEFLPVEAGGRDEGSSVVACDEDLFDWGRARFIEEAVRLQELSIPGLAAVRDVVPENGTAYLVREHVAGRSLIDWADQLGRRPTQSELDLIATGLTAALGALHKAGLLHHDITPDHILLRQETLDPVLIDFGAARSAFAVRARQPHTYVRPGYSPPEQHMFDEGALGPWTDIFATAGSLYRAVMARAPTDVIGRNIKDDMAKAAVAASKQYRPMFLQAIDAGLLLAPRARPQAIEELSLRLLATPASQRTPQPRPRKSTPPKPAPAPPARPAESSRPRGLAVSPSIVAVSALSLVTLAAIGIAVSRRPPPLVDVPTSSYSPPVASPAPVAPAPVRPAPQTPGRSVEAEVAAATDRETLLELLRGNPALANLIAGRLEALGYIDVRPSGESFWTRPGNGEVFRDCPDCPELVAVPAGEVLLGSPADEPGHGDDEDDTPGPGGHQPRAVFTAPLGIARTEVTRGEFAEFVRASGYRMGIGCHARVDIWRLVEDLTWRATGYAQDDRHPVACVSWNDAVAYTRWLSARTGRTYRLPTEAEWEYAARGVTTATRQPRFPFGDDEREICSFANGADLATKADNPDWQVAECSDGYAATAPVGRFKSNAFGIADMQGNVWEWTADCWRDRLDPPPRRKSDTCAADAPRVLKGGSFSDPPRMLRPATRVASAPSIRDQIAGFRVVREVPR